MQHTHKGYAIRIEQDELATSPREDFNIGKLILDHKRYNLPWEVEGLDKENPVYYVDGDKWQPRRCQSWADIWTAAEQALKEDGDEVITSLPVFGYNHSCLDLATKIRQTWWHYSWDGGRLGWIIATRKTLTEAGLEFDTPEKIAEINRQLSGEVDTYAQYMNGDVYYYVIEDEDGETIDSCGGFYGYDNCLAAAKEACPEPALEGEPEI